MDIKRLAIILSVLGLAVLAWTCKKDLEPSVDDFEIFDRVEASSTSATITGTYEWSGKVKGIMIRVGKRNDLSDGNLLKVAIDGNLFSVELIGLEEGLEYHYRYEVNYGGRNNYITTTKIFNTITLSIPQVGTSAITEIGVDYALCGGIVANDGGAEIKARGVCYGTEPNPNLNGSHTVDSCGTGSFTSFLNGLLPGMHYYARAYATNAKGTAYGDAVSFDTPSAYVVTVASIPINGGTVSGGGYFTEEEVCTVTAEANIGYYFDHWAENENYISSEANFSFPVTTNKNLAAYFTAQGFVINATANPSEGGVLMGSGGYNYGDTCKMSAVPRPGYKFVVWKEDGNSVSVDANYSFMVTRDRSLEACFTTQGFVISATAEPVDGGTVQGSGGFDYGQTCTLIASPNTGYSFTRWVENDIEVATDATYSFTVMDDRVLKACFSAISYHIDVAASPSDGGTVTGAGDYQFGQTCTVTAEANSGYNFINWTENGNPVSNDRTFSFTVSNQRNLVAHFTTQSYLVTATAEPETGGSITGSGGYNFGQTCTLTATANTGYNFINWTENNQPVSSDAIYSFTVTESRSLKAHFTTQNFVISAIADPVDGGAVNGSGGYDYGQTCTLSAIPNVGYEFIKWTENDNEVSNNATYVFTVEGSRALKAHFGVKHYSIVVSANPTSGGTVSGGGSFVHGETCTVTATEFNGYGFTNWTEGGSNVSSNANYTFLVTGNRTLVANFVIQSCAVTALSDPANGGTVAGGGNYYYGQQCTLTATPSSGYSFVRWTKEGVEVSTEANYSFVVTESATYVAQFQVQSYTITVNANPSAGGSVSGGGTYTHGQICTVVAAAIGEYHFSYWSENGQQVSPNVTYSFPVTCHRILTANFSNGVIQGLFTVNESGDQVLFSQGNLQYIGSASTPYWKFADHQWDYFGANGQESDSQTADRDLFGWGTSGYDHGAICYQPWSISNDNSDYYAYGNSILSLCDNDGRADWGYNAISNGGNMENSGWRTLTGDEWGYVFDGRQTNDGIRFARAVVNGRCGVILLPDDWSSSYYSLSCTNNSNSTYDCNVITASQWPALEQHGAVFLPAAGYRNGTSVNNSNSYGYYYSSSSFGDNVIEVSMGGWYIDPQYTGCRWTGNSVRLVRSVPNRRPKGGEGRCELLK